jgi:DnaK suppressor protein
MTIKARSNRRSPFGYPLGFGDRPQSLNLDRESGLLREVDSALTGIADGSYGICLRCEEEIKPKRLDAIPWAKYCLRCQEAIDQFEIEPGDSVDKLLAA